MLYQDDIVSMDETGFSVKGRKGEVVRRVEYPEICGAEMFEMGFWTGKYRLVGIGFGRPRTWFPWDGGRASKTHAISLDTGKFMKLALTPDDPKAVFDLIRDRAGL